jgi:hypothetical protein
VLIFEKRQPDIAALLKTKSKILFTMPNRNKSHKAKDDKQTKVDDNSVSQHISNAMLAAECSSDNNSTITAFRISDYIFNTFTVPIKSECLLSNHCLKREKLSF